MRHAKRNRSRESSQLDVLNFDAGHYAKRSKFRCSVVDQDDTRNMGAASHTYLLCGSLGQESPLV